VPLPACPQCNFVALFASAHPHPAGDFDHVSFTFRLRTDRTMPAPAPRSTLPPSPLAAGATHRLLWALAALALLWLTVRWALA